MNERNDDQVILLLLLVDECFCGTDNKCVTIG
jgi:hypothetical protein